jgi:hypothetical protein
MERTCNILIILILVTFVMCQIIPLTVVLAFLYLASSSIWLNLARMHAIKACLTKIAHFTRTIFCRVFSAQRSVESAWISPSKACNDNALTPAYKQITRNEAARRHHDSGRIL